MFFCSFQTHFQFHGVYVGSQQRIPFSLTNRSVTSARVAFHLPDHKDFFVQVPPPSTSSHQQHGTDPSLNGVEIQAGQTEECSLVFSPTQVKVDHQSAGFRETLFVSVSNETNKVVSFRKVNEILL